MTGGIVLGIGGLRNKKPVNNDERPVKIIEVSYGIYHIVYADEPSAK